MKNLVYLITLIFLISSCTKKDSFLYAEKAGLQFHAAGGNLKTDYNFAMQTDPESPVWEPYFYGDSLLSDTLVFRVDLLGEPTAEGRQYYLTTTTIEGQDPQKAPNIEFLNPYVLEANKIRDTIKIIIHRPESRGVFSTGVTFDLDKSKGTFEKGVIERSVMEFEISDRYAKPEGWNEQYFGEYSEEKYAFFITVLHMEFVPWMDWMFDSFKQTLKERLQQFNEENPDNPKNFTFPG